MQDENVRVSQNERAAKESLDFTPDALTLHS
jgi:hypothetical protein